MTTPLLMLALMMGPYVLVRLLSATSGRDLDARGAAAIGLGLLFVFTGIGHFAQTQVMALMLPAWMPARVPLVWLTGLVEFVIALGFFMPRTRRIAGWTAAVVLVAFFPANIHAALNHVPMGGHAWGPQYLLLRAPVQVVILAWRCGSPSGRPVTPHLPHIRGCDTEAVHSRHLNRPGRSNEAMDRPMDHRDFRAPRRGRRRRLRAGLPRHGARRHLEHRP